jgi:Xaa-Pro aminopeptidase
LQLPLPLASPSLSLRGPKPTTRIRSSPRELSTAQRVAVDDHMWAARVFALTEALPGVQLQAGGDLISNLRMYKSEPEIEALTHAGEAIDRVHDRMGEWLRAGRTEREVGADIAAAILAEGHERVDFVIVASGPNGASPHHEVSDRVIEPGDPVVVDIGGTNAAGYCSDSTRTYVVGTNPDPQFLELYAVLLAAQKAQCEAARPGLTAAELDAVGRDVIEAAGFGEFFIHRTGHGIGLETHEEPYIVAGNNRVLETAMAFSIEPGIYLPGRFGARIEDIVVCTSDGARRLNTTTRELRFFVKSLVWCGVAQVPVRLRVLNFAPAPSSRVLSCWHSWCCFSRCAKRPVQASGVASAAVGGAFAATFLWRWHVVAQCRQSRGLGGLMGGSRGTCMLSSVSHCVSS